MAALFGPLQAKQLRSNGRQDSQHPMAAAPLSNASDPAAAAARAGAAASAAQAVRYFGRFQLLRLSGKSARTMVWRVDDPRVGQELLLAMPRSRPADDGAAHRWHQTARLAMRVSHPSLAAVVEVGEQEGWPFIVYDPGQSSALSEILTTKGQPALTAVPWALQILQGLAFAHEAGLAHLDLQTCMVLLPEAGPARLIGLGVALEPVDQPSHTLQGQRQASERDVLALGIVLHHVLAGVPALDQADPMLVAERLPPLGRDLVRLPRTTAHPIPEALRAIVNRATERQERHRYRNARTVVRALEGWLASEGEQGGGPLAMLQERMRSGGLLPAMPGASRRSTRFASMQQKRNDEVAELVLKDIALSFELLRSVNSAQVRGAMAAGNGPILTIRRALDMLGLDGIQRAANVLKPWPGSLNEAQATGLEQLIARVLRAAQIARWLRPAGYDAELVHLLACLQNLGRLVLHYHFPEEAVQIERLMKPDLPKQAGDHEEPGMSVEAASFAVLGVDFATLGTAIGRMWGLDDGVLHMMQRVAHDTPVRNADTDTELLRLTASCANEVVDATTLAPALQAHALQRIVQRFGRVLGVTLRDVQLTAQGHPPEPATVYAVRPAEQAA